MDLTTIALAYQLELVVAAWGLGGIVVLIARDVIGPGGGGDDEEEEEEEREAEELRETRSHGERSLGQTLNCLILPQILILILGRGEVKGRGGGLVRVKSQRAVDVMQSTLVFVKVKTCDGITTDRSLVASNND